TVHCALVLAVVRGGQVARRSAARRARGRVGQAMHRPHGASERSGAVHGATRRRRAGKDRFLSAVAVHRAALAADWREHMSAGEQAVVLLLGVDKKQATILRRYAEGLLQAPLLAAEVVRKTDDGVEFGNGAVLEVATNDARLVRGRSAIAVLGSE